MTTLSSSGCRQEMFNQPRVEPMEQPTLAGLRTSYFEAVPGTVARGQWSGEPALETGRGEVGFVQYVPMRLNLEDLHRGQERFNIYCAPCHDRTGRGEGMIVRRGFLQPPSLHEDRLREVEVGYLFDVATNGVGLMFGYGDRISTEDRWRIAAYIRALQRSQNAELADVPESKRAQLDRELR